MTQPQKNWRSLAEAASTETDSNKLMGLVQELNRAIDEEREPTLFHRSGSSEGAPVEPKTNAIRILVADDNALVRVIIYLTDC